MLQDRITALGSFFRGIESYNQALIVKVTYPEKWGYYDSADGKIKVAKSEDTINEYFYYGDSKEIDLDRIFDLIDETITMNQNVLKKVELLKTKIAELKELFDVSPLEKLETLEFSFKETKKEEKPKRKYTKRAKASDVQTAKEETNDTVIENVELEENNMETPAVVGAFEE